MWSYLKDKFASAKLNARYQRLMQEQLLELTERSGPLPVAEDPGNWRLVGDGKSSVTETERQDLREQARQLVTENPHACQMLRLLEIYTVGPGLRLHHTTQNENLTDLVTAADRLWREFLTGNRRHFSYREFARRTWRDGECFLRLFPQQQWPPAVRFVDPESIGETTDHKDSQGVLTTSDDVETVLSYLHIDLATGELIEEIPAEEVLHPRIGVDSNQKRGLTIFAPVVKLLGCFDAWREIELTARKLQASIVLWRKVQGSPTQATALADAAQTSSTPTLTGTTRKERYQAGTILTTTQGTDLEFLHPQTNFGDAVPLGRMLLLGIAAGAGLPEFMLTADASNANYASTMVAEGPAVKMFESEQQFFANEFSSLWRWVMSEAIRLGLLPGDFFSQITHEWTFPQLVNRDRNQERLSHARLAEAKILSKAEVARRDGADPERMRSEIEEERRIAG